MSNCNEYPCKRDCERRNSECHSTCKEWLVYERKHQADLEKKRKPSIKELMHWNNARYRKVMRNKT